MPACHRLSRLFLQQHVVQDSRQGDMSQPALWVSLIDQDVSDVMQVRNDLVFRLTCRTIFGSGTTNIQPTMTSGSTAQVLAQRVSMYYRIS